MVFIQPEICLHSAHVEFRDSIACVPVYVNTGIVLYFDVQAFV